MMMNRRRRLVAALALMFATLVVGASAATAVDRLADASATFFGMSAFDHSFSGSPEGNYLFLEQLGFFSLALLGTGDPSACYSLGVTNTGADAGDVFISFDVPIAALGMNTVRATLSVDLEDTNGDNNVSLEPGFPGAIQRGLLTEGMSASLIPVDLGTSLNTPGVHTFEVGTMMSIDGPTSASNGFLTLLVAFTLSAGDTATLRGQIVQDDGTDAPVCEIPPLPPRKSAVPAPALAGWGATLLALSLLSFGTWRLTRRQAP
jgi:hypothetical protein